MNRLVHPFGGILDVVLAAYLGGCEPGVAKSAAAEEFLWRFYVSGGPAIAAATPAVCLRDDVLFGQIAGSVHLAGESRPVGTLGTAGIDRERVRIIR